MHHSSITYITIAGEVIGMLATTFTRSDTAFLGFYAVHPNYQRIGIGKELWSETLSRFDSTINIGLNGVPTMSEKYKKSGFIFEDTIRMIVYESLPKGEQPYPTHLLKSLDELMGCRLVVIDGETDELMFKKLVEYDYSVQKFSREKLLRLYLKGDSVPLTLAIVKDHSRSKFASDQTTVGGQVHPVSERKMSCCAKPSEVSIIEDEALSTNIKSSLSISSSNLCNLPLRSSSPIDIPSIISSAVIPNQSQETVVHSSSIDLDLGGCEILGYGCIRLDNNSGGMIGPIYADSGDICEVLLRNLMERFNLQDGHIFSIMALSSNKQASKSLTKIGFNEIEQCSRMFTKFIPAASYSKIYYVHSPNFTLF